MAWLETSPVEQRERFIRDHRVGLYTMAELCARYAVSRKMGYKWLARFEAAGRAGLQDRSRAPELELPAISTAGDLLARRGLVKKRRRRRHYAHPGVGPIQTTAPNDLFFVKRVTNAGTIRLRKRLLFIATALTQYPVGLEEVDDGIWSTYFCRVLLGRVDERNYIIRTWMCYPCCRFAVLPMFPVAQSSHKPLRHGTLASCSVTARASQ
jgi:hypothetical protein